MKKDADAATAPIFWEIREMTVERRLRVGACPVLSVKVSYPMMMESETSDGQGVSAARDAVARFNACYADATEAFVRSGLEKMGPQIQAAYGALGSEAAHRFARRELVCRMEVQPQPVNKKHRPLGARSTPLAPRFFGADSEEQYLQVCIECLSGYRHSPAVTRRSVGLHIWQFPKGIMKAHKVKL